jgi:hypothetical protein
MTGLLERLLTDEACFGLTEATPVQRAWCRIVEGVPIGELAGDANVIASLGCEPSALPTARPQEIYFVAATRSGKSLFAACVAFWAAMTCDLGETRESDDITFSIVSLNTKKAKAVYKHVVGTTMAKRKLRRFVVGEPTRESIRLLRPDGRQVTIEIVAGSPQGGGLASTFSCGCVFDEATRMSGEKSGSVVNFDEQRRTVMTRLLPGAPMLAIGSPWAPRGPIWEAVQEFWGKPCGHLIVLRGTGPMLNPKWWSEDRIERVRALPQGDTMYRTDCLGEFADPESSFFTVEDLQGVTRATGDKPREEGWEYYAAMDPATKSNSWTLVIIGKQHMKGGGVRLVVSKVQQWTPRKGSPLMPEVVLAEIKAACVEYGVHRVLTDQWSGAALEAIARLLKGFTLQSVPLTTTEFATFGESLRTRVRNKTIEFPNDRVFRADLLSVRKLYTSNGYRLALPLTADGRHADYVPATVLACEHAGQSPSWLGAMRKMLDEGTTLFGQGR